MARQLAFEAAGLIVLWLLAWCGNCMPIEGVCWALFAAAALVSVLAAVFHGIVRAKRPPLKRRWWQSGVVALVLGLVIMSAFTGVLQACGENEWMKAQELSSHWEEIVERYGEYRNPHLINEEICKRTFVSCGALMILWAWLMLVAGVSERLTAWRSRTSSRRVSSSVAKGF